MAFTHLHVHTEYSLLDGSGKIDEMIAQAKELGMDSLAITDHGVMYGVIDFYKAAVDKGIKPIIGCEIYMTNGSRFDRETGKGDDRYYHLVLLAENNEGYNNLMKIVSTGFIEGFYYKPRVDYETLKKYSKGIIASSACLAGIIPKLILRGKYDDACREALRMQDIFGRGNFFLELQDHGIPEQRRVNQQLVRMGEELDIPLICTNDIHYTYSTDAEAHDILLCVQTGKKAADQDRMRYEGGQYYMKSPEEMAELFKAVPEAVKNTEEIAQRCNVTIEFGVQKLPRFDVPEGFTADEYLTTLCEEGLRRRYTDPEKHEDRLHYELGVIKQMGYVDYFLIVWDFINFAKSRGIMVGPGRGSAAGSLVSYCLAITDIDPIKYNLIFERFLNPERVSMPDIDVDFADSRRGEVIDYVTEKYGRDCVTQIVTFGTMKARNAIRDVGRVIDMPYGAVDSIAKMIPAELNITIEAALKANVDLKRAYETDAQVHYLIEMAQRLEGLPRNASIHASGVVIAREPLMEYVPLARGNDGSVVTQYTMTRLEQLGLLKMDFLGLRTETVIQNAVGMIRENSGNHIDMIKIDFNDKNVLDMIGSGKTSGVFQLESQGMTNFMRELKPHSLEDIIAGIALYRPGPMDFIPKYLAGKNSGGEITYDCPQLKPILETTYGCIVYQEQVMQIVRDLAGYTLGGADEVRRAMAKKKEAVMKAERQRFVYGSGEPGEKNYVPGCIRNGISEAVANKIYDDMTDFAKYAFNKSHAASYGVVAMQTAYLKYYYPAEYMAAIMSSVMGDLGKLSIYIQECKRLGIKILAPDINKSEAVFMASGNSIRYGLSAIKGVGRNVIDRIIAERDHMGPYKDIYDLAERLDGPDLNKRSLENFIKAGALDCFGLTRKQLINIYMDVVDNVNADRKSAMSGQMTLFDLVTEENKGSLQIKVPDIGEFDRMTLLGFEKEVTGIYISGHPLDDYADILKKNVTARSADFAVDDEGKVAVKDLDIVTVGGVVEDIVSKTTKKGEPMAFVTLEDLYGTLECIVFPRVLAENRNSVAKGSRLLIRGRVSVDADAAGKLIAEKITPFDMVGTDIWIIFRNRDEYTLQRPYLESLGNMPETAGDSPVYIYLSEPRQKKISPECMISSSPEVLKMLRARYGEANVRTAARKLT